MHSSMFKRFKWCKTLTTINKASAGCCSTWKGAKKTRAADVSCSFATPINHSQEEKECILQDMNRVYAFCAFAFSCFIAQLSFVLKKWLGRKDAMGWSNKKGGIYPYYLNRCINSLFRGNWWYFGVLVFHICRRKGLLRQAAGLCVAFRCVVGPWSGTMEPMTVPAVSINYSQH